MALPHASHSCPGATFSAVLVQHLWWPPGKVLETSCDSSGLASPGPAMLGLASCLGAPAGLTSQAPHPGVPFWHCPQALAWWCHGVVVPLPSLVPVHAPPQPFIIHQPAHFCNFHSLSICCGEGSAMAAADRKSMKKIQLKEE